MPLPMIDFDFDHPDRVTWDEFLIAVEKRVRYVQKLSAREAQALQKQSQPMPWVFYPTD